MSATNSRVLPRSSPRWDSYKVRRSISKTLMVLLLVTPGMVLFLTFVLMPVAQSARYSIYNWNGYGEPRNNIGAAKVNAEWEWWSNYEKLYEHEVFRTAVFNSLKIMMLSVSVQLPFALVLALLVGRGNLPGRRLFRGILFIPFVFSEIIAALIWQYVLHPSEDGLANKMLDMFSHDPVTWLGDKNVVMYAIFAVLTWKYFGVYMILYMAGLQGVPRDLEDAARVDGANWWQALTRITLPLMGSTIRLTIYLSVLGSLQQFVLVQVLTRGGNPFNNGHVISTYLYKFGVGGNRAHIGYGSAVAVVLFFFCLLFSLGYQRIVMQRDYSQDSWGG